MPWLYLLIAGLLEIAWATAMKRSDGFTRPWPSALTVLGQIASFALLALAMPVWLAALIVTVVLFAAAGVAALIGKKQVQQAVPPAPTAAAWRWCWPSP